MLEGRAFADAQCAAEALVQQHAGAPSALACRCGLELDFGTMRRFKYPAMRLALLPGLVRAQLGLPAVCKLCGKMCSWAKLDGQLLPRLAMAGWLRSYGAWCPRNVAGGGIL